MAKRLAVITIEYDDEDYSDAYYVLWASELGYGDGEGNVIVRKVEECGII